MIKINDKVLLGLVAGFLGNIPKTILCTTLNYSGITKQKCSDLASGIFLSKRTAKTLQGNIFGIISDFVTASLDGVALVYFLIHTGKVNKKNALIKGFVSGQISFALFRGVFARLGTSKSYPKDILTNTVMNLNSSVWGISTGLLIFLLGNESLFKKKMQPEATSNCTPTKD